MTSLRREAWDARNWDALDIAGYSRRILLGAQLDVWNIRGEVH